MKKINTILIGLTILAGTSCKKDSTDNSGTPTPTPSTTCMVVKEMQSDGSYSNYTYNSSNQVTAYNSFNAADTSSQDVTFAYSGNKVTMSSGGLDAGTYYLNSKGFADSMSLIIPGFIELHYVYTYNSSNEVTKEQTFGSFLGTDFEEMITYEYVNGNRTKETADDGSNVTVTTFEYYTDKINYAAKSEQAYDFVNANKNLVKKVTNPDGSYTNYTYEYDSNGKAIKQIATDDASVITFTNYTWQCK